MFSQMESGYNIVDIVVVSFRDIYLPFCGGLMKFKAILLTVRRAITRGH